MSNFTTINHQLINVFKNNKKKIQYFSKTKNKWEKWLQYELAATLNELGTTETEYKYPYDQKSIKPESKDGFSECRVDIKFKQKNFTNDKYTVIELKQSNSTSGLRGVFSDLLKISAIRESKWDIRGVVAILIYRMPETKTKFADVLDYLQNPANGTKIEYDIQNHQNINGTDFNALIIGWGTGKSDGWDKIKYRNWVRKMQKLTENEIKIKTKSGRKST